MRLTIGEMPSLAGAELASEVPVTVTQADIDAFAAASGDGQWIHVDPDRAAEGPFDGTIVHGYLMLSLLGGFWTRMLEVTDATEGLNYGLDRVRFLRPVPVDSEVSMHARIREVRSLGEPRVGARVYADVELRLRGEERPAVVAATILQYSR